MRGQTDQPEIVDARARHIAESLDNISVPALDDATGLGFGGQAFNRTRRGVPTVLPGW
jgi:hypothetical protein